MTATFALLVTALGYWMVQAYDNDFDRPLYKECPNGQAFYRMYSSHDNGKEDRRWTFYCRSCPALSSGQYSTWHNDVNDFDTALDFKCTDGVVCGVRSEHDNGREDRVWSFKCCKPSGRKSCQFSSRSTGYVNNFDQVLSWQTPSSSQFVFGYNSYHDNKYEDRRWKVYYGQPTCTDQCVCGRSFDDSWEVRKVDYQLDQYTLEPGEPEVVATKNIDNYSSKASSSVTVALTARVTESSTFSDRRGVSTHIESTITAQVPFVTASLTVGLGVSRDHTWGQSESYTKDVKREFTVDAPPNTHVIGKAVMTKGFIDIPFTMTLRHKSYDCTCTVSGTWQGVEHYNLDHLVVDKDGNEMTFTANGSPNHGTPSTLFYVVSMISFLLVWQEFHQVH